jgi:hypothetical protein
MRRAAGRKGGAAGGTAGPSVPAESVGDCYAVGANSRLSCLEKFRAGGRSFWSAPGASIGRVGRQMKRTRARCALRHRTAVRAWRGASSCGRRSSAWGRRSGATTRVGSLSDTVYDSDWIAGRRVVMPLSTSRITIPFRRGDREPVAKCRTPNNLKENNHGRPSGSRTSSTGCFPSSRRLAPSSSGRASPRER